MMKTPRFSVHPVCELFPELDDQSFASLVSDMRENGQREPIIVLGNQILDGRNRYRACMKLGLEPKVREWKGKGSIVGFVVSMNIHRRHLDASQRATIAAEIAKIRPDDTAAANLQQEESTVRERVSASATAMNVSERSVFHATAVADKGAPALAKAVKSGDVPVSLAAQAIKVLPTAAQVKAMRSEDPKAALREAVKNSAPKPPKSGKEKAGPKDRKAALKAYGVLCRALQKIGKYEKCLDRLEWIAKEIKA